jgi:hypothetical protein
MNPNPTTYDVPSGLSNLLSAYDEAHWETVVLELKPGSGVLLRGSVLSLVAGKCELVSATNQATVFGVLLDEAVDTSAAYSDASVTGSIARAGSFRAQALIVSPGTDPVALQSALRDIGIYVHGVILVPAAAESASAHRDAVKRPRTGDRSKARKARKAIVSLVAANRLRARIALVTFLRGWGATLILPAVVRAARRPRHATLLHQHHRVSGSILCCG